MISSSNKHALSHILSRFLLFPLQHIPPPPFFPFLLPPEPPFAIARNCLFQSSSNFLSRSPTFPSPFFSPAEQEQEHPPPLPLRSPLLLLSRRFLFGGLSWHGRRGEGGKISPPSFSLLYLTLVLSLPPSSFCRGESQREVSPLFPLSRLSSPIIRAA